MTFNYGRVLEIEEWLLLPRQDATSGDHGLKLHGSVDWKRNGDAIERAEAGEHFAATCVPSELAMAPLGPAKARMIVDLEPLWKLAEQRLAAANAVGFIGYRFPPTAATARTRR